MNPRVAIVTDDPGWHGKRLNEALAARGVDSRYTSLSQAHIRLDHEVAVTLCGFDDGLPDAVFVRGIPGGTLEQTVYYLNVLHALHDLGVLVYNDGRAIERSVDKSYTSLRLRQMGIPTPETWIVADADRANEIVRRETADGGLLMCKPLFGAQGQGIVCVAASGDLPDEQTTKGVWYLQRFVGDRSGPASDWRVFVIDGHAVAAMRRTAQGRLANVALGGQCHAAVPEGELGRLAESAVVSLDMAYAGVDLVRDHDGRWWVIEVNSIPAWKGLQGVSQVDIAACLAEDLLRRCESVQFGEAVS